MRNIQGSPACRQSSTMGVVYKLRQEVADFIIHQKETNPSLSCRRLAEMASEVFQINLSKSSVNTVLKNAALSSAVGRRPGSSPIVKKFHIPSQKKDQIREAMHKAGVKKVPLPKKEAPLTAIPVEKKQLPSAAAAGQPKAPAAARPRFPSYESFLKHVQQWRQQRRSRHGPLLPGMGWILLKAAEWELFPEGALGNLLRKHIRGHVPKDFDALCACALYAQLAGLHLPEDAGALGSNGLGALHALSAAALSPQAFEWAKTVSPSLPLWMENAGLKREALLTVGEFRLYLEDGSFLRLDPSLARFWPQGIPSEVFLPANKAMEMLSHAIISNNDPLILLCAGEKQISRPLLECAAAFEGLKGKRMVKTVVLDRGGDTVAEFTTIPAKKRFWMAGVWPDQDVLAELQAGLKKGKPEPLYCEALDRVIFFRDYMHSVFKDSKLVDIQRVINIYAEEGGTLVGAVVSNAQHLSAEDILERFFLRWPALDRGFYGRILREEVLSGATAPEASNSAQGQRSETPPCEEAPSLPRDVGGILEDWGRTLHSYALERFWGQSFSKDNTNIIIPSCYDISGAMDAAEKFLRVELEVPSDYPYREALAAAVARINESAITDPSGRNLFIALNI